MASAEVGKLSPVSPVRVITSCAAPGLWPTRAMMATSGGVSPTMASRSAGSASYTRGSYRTTLASSPGQTS